MGTWQRDPDWLEAEYNNRLRVPAFAEHLQYWREASAQARVAAHGRSRLDVPYGHSPAETLDVFRPERSPKGGAPVMLFIHGGYWRSLDNADHSFVDPAFTLQGVCVVVPNYALCPAVGMSEIALQMTRAVAWTVRHAADFGGDPTRITVVGHSAGGHLAAMLLGCDWAQGGADVPPHAVRTALSISGLFQLEPLRHTPFLANDLRMDAAEAKRLSPALWPAPAHGRLVALVGGDESSEFLRQNALIQQAWGQQRVPVCAALPGLNHFSVLEALAQPGHRLHRQALGLLQA